MKKIMKRLTASLLAFAVLIPTLLSGTPVHAATTNAKAIFAGHTTEEVLAAAESGLGVPYVYGGSTTSGWDCSGYVTWVGRKLGVDMGRTTSNIASYCSSAGATVTSGSSDSQFNSDFNAGIIKPGDVLIFFNSSGETVHAAIVGKNQTIYHAWYEGVGTINNRFDKVWDVNGGHGKVYATYTIYRGVEDKGKATIQKVSSNTSVTKDNDCYSLAGATYGIYSNKDCNNRVASLTTDKNGNTDTIEIKAGTYYVKEIEAPKGFKLDSTVHTLTVKAGETTTLKVSDTPKATTTLIELSKIDMETSDSTPQGKASLEGAVFVWKYYDGYYTKENLPSEPTRTWVTQTKAETGSDNEIHYMTGLSDSYKVSGDSFYRLDGSICLPLGTITVEEQTAPTGYLLEGAYMQTKDSSEQITGLYVAQITEDGEFAVLSGSNQYSVSDKVIRGGVKIQKRDLETGDTKAQGGATLKDTVFTITSLNENPVLVNGKLYNKNEVVLTIYTGIDGIATTDADTLPYGKYRIEESESPEGYLKTGATSHEFEITEDGKIADLTDEKNSVYNQIKRGDIEGVKIGAGTHKRLANVPFKITSKTTGESHIIVTDNNGQFSTSADWVSHKQNTNAGTSSEDGIWFGTSEPDDSKGALLYDTYEIEELRCNSNKGLKLIPAFEVIVSKNNTVIDLGTLVDEYEEEITIHTTATDKVTGEKSIVAGKEVTIVDTVTLDGLVKGTKYTLKGWEMVKSENAELLVDGERVENELAFTATDSKMAVQIEFTFNASELAGKDLVTFEELYDVTNPDEPIKVAEHKDIEDDGQTVTITERVITMHTTATDKTTGEKSIVADENVTIVDTVILDGLEKGVEYLLTGCEMVKSENAELLIDGKRVENDLTFTAEDSKMEVQIEFTFNASELAGKELVTFEELYDVTNPENPIKVAEHRDIEDDGQTVTITEKPDTPTTPDKPKEPEKPDTPTTTHKTSDSPKTGDASPFTLLFAMMGISAAGLIFAAYKKFRWFKKVD